MILAINKTELRKHIIITFIFGFIAYGFCYFNANFSHDSLLALYSDDFETMLRSGRFIRPLYTILKGKVTLPLLNGVLFLLFFGISSYLILDLIGIKNSLFKFIACGVLVTNYSVSLLNATYFHDLDSYGLSILLAVCGATIQVRCLRRWKWPIVITLNILSLGLYQAYIQVPVVIFLIQAISGIIEDENILTNIRNLTCNLVIILISMILYFAIYKVILIVYHLSTSELYNSPSSALTANISLIIANFRNTIGLIRSWICSPHGCHQTLIKLINYALIILTFLSLLLLCTSRHITFRKAILILFYTALIPFGMSFICLLCGKDSHELMIFSFFLCYLFLMNLAQHASTLTLTITVKSWRVIQSLISILIGIIIFDNIIFSNQICLKKELENQATLSTVTRIIDRLEQTDEYIAGETPVVFIGSLSLSEVLNQNRPGYTYYASGLWSNYTPTYDTTLISYFDNYLNYPINIQLDESDSWSDDIRVKNMSAFPAKDSIKIIDDAMIVKLS